MSYNPYYGYSSNGPMNGASYGGMSDNYSAIGGNPFARINNTPSQFTQNISPNNYMPNSPQQFPQQPIGLNGKIVEGYDIVKATEIPMGGYGLFPKADLNEIYFKAWQADGTTKITTYRPVIEEAPKSEQNNSFNIILERLDKLEGALNNFINQKTTIQPMPMQPAVQSIPVVQQPVVPMTPAPAQPASQDNSSVNMINQAFDNL